LENILNPLLSVLIATLYTLIKTNKRDKKGIKKRIAAIDNLLFLQLKRDKSTKTKLFFPEARCVLGSCDFTLCWLPPYS